jgi:hypothetical protein
MAGQDKRRAPRQSHNSVVEIYDESGDSIAEIAHLVDFSNVGACFSTPKSFKIGQKLRLRLRLLREGRLYIWAHIVRVQKKPNTVLYGIEFDKVRDVG